MCLMVDGVSYPISGEYFVILLEVSHGASQVHGASGVVQYGASEVVVVDEMFGVRNCIQRERQICACGLLVAVVEGGKRVLW